MLSSGPNYTSLLIGALLGSGLLYLFVAVRKILARKAPTEIVEEKPALDPSGKLNVRFALGGVQAVLMLCIVMSFLPLLFGFRGEGVTWKGFALLLLFNIMLGSSIIFALRKKDLSWMGSWVDPSSVQKSVERSRSEPVAPASEAPAESGPA